MPFPPARYVREGRRRFLHAGAPAPWALLCALLACAAPIGSGRSPGAEPPTQGGGTPPVVVDGVPAEWDDVAPAWELPPADRPPRDEPGPPRPVALRLQGHGPTLYLLIDLDREVNLQSMSGSLRLALDGDGDPRTGEQAGGLQGADLVVDFSHRPESGSEPFGQGILVREAGEALWEDAYGVGLLYAPTWASTRFEVRLALPSQAGRSPAGAPPGVRLRLATLGASGEEVAATPVLAHVPAPVDAPPRRDGTPAVERAPGSDLRILTWNVGDRGMMRTPAPYLRLIAALAPDVLLLDELNPAMDSLWLAETLGGLSDGATWQVVMGTGGGRQRTAVAAKVSLTPRPELGRVPWPDSVVRLEGLPMSNQMRGDLATAREDDLPTVGATTVIQDRTLLFVPLDLMCCGRAGGPEDRARIMAVEAIRSAVQAALAAGDIGGVVVGGDLNLVGSREPLDRLRTGLDPAGGDLVSAPTPRLDGASTMTWRSPGPFPPGQLDHVLVSGSSLEILRSFAFDPADLSVGVRNALGVRPEDGEVTDHLPLVVDVRIRR